MKIEMGESLFYSWLRHVKECQIVQTNWKVSPQWTIQHVDELQELMKATDSFFQEKYDYNIYKKNASLSQIIQQGECDALGLSLSDGAMMTYAVDVAFHEGGLNYGDRKTTVMKVVNKCLRTAMCIYGFMDTKDAEIAFASPKIHKSILNDIIPALADAQAILQNKGFSFRLRLIANDDFETLVLKPILLVSDGVADTSELFLRAYQLTQMFEQKAIITLPDEASCQNVASNEISKDAYSELKIGKIVQTVFRHLLESGEVSREEVALLQDAEYSKNTFDLQFPCLVKEKSGYDKSRYYVAPVTIRGEQYHICSQWFEVPANNDRPYLIKWINEKLSDISARGEKE